MLTHIHIDSEECVAILNAIHGYLSIARHFHVDQNGSDKERSRIKDLEAIQEQMESGHGAFMPNLTHVESLLFAIMITKPAFMHGLEAYKEFKKTHPNQKAPENSIFPEDVDVLNTAEAKLAVVAIHSADFKNQIYFTKHFLMNDFENLQPVPQTVEEGLRDDSNQQHVLNFSEDECQMLVNTLGNFIGFADEKGVIANATPKTMDYIQSLYDKLSQFANGTDFKFEPTPHYIYGILLAIIAMRPIFEHYAKAKELPKDVRRLKPEEMDAFNSAEAKLVLCAIFNAKKEDFGKQIKLFKDLITHNYRAFIPK